MNVLVKLASGVTIEVQYDDLLVVRRSHERFGIPATVELVLEDHVAAELIDSLLAPEQRPRYLQ